jgi:hypothetical protein
VDSEQVGTPVMRMVAFAQDIQKVVRRKGFKDLLKV